METSRVDGVKAPRNRRAPRYGPPGLAHVLNRVADSPRLGVDACVALHAGLDASAAFWILDLRFGFLDGAFP